jgi:uncharacterized protein (DUF58 family)
MRQTNRRHDLIAVHIEDPCEKVLPDVGILSLEDAETGELIELDTTVPTVRKLFNQHALEHAAQLMSDIRREGVDAVELKTNAPYLPALLRFFKTRERRRI